MAHVKCGSSWFDLASGDISTLAHSTAAAALAPFAKCGVYVSSMSGSTAPILPIGSDLSEVWISWYLYSSTTTHPGDAQILRLLKDGVNVFQLDSDSGSFYSAELWNGSTWTEMTAETPMTINGSQVRRYDVHLKIADADGIIEVFQNGNLTMSFYGDTSLGGPTSVNQMQFGGLHLTATQAIVSAIMVRTDDTRNKVYAGPDVATGEGDVSQWAGAYTAVDDTTDAATGDLDFVTSATAGEVSTYAVAALNATLTGGGFTVSEVVTNVRAAIGAGSPIDGIEPAVRSGTTNGFGTLTDGLAVAPVVPVEGVFTTDPATGAAWTPAAASAAQPGMRSAA